MIMFNTISSSLTFMHIFCVSCCRAIVLEPGNPSMKNQIKQLAAAEGMHFVRICLVDNLYYFIIGMNMRLIHSYIW